MKIMWFFFYFYHQFKGEKGKGDGKKKKGNELKKRDIPKAVIGMMKKIVYLKCTCYGKNPRMRCTRTQSTTVNSTPAVWHVLCSSLERAQESKLCLCPHRAYKQTSFSPGKHVSEELLQTG